MNNLTGHDHGGTENGVQLDTAFIPKPEVIESMQQRLDIVGMQAQVLLISNIEIVKMIAYSEIVQRQVSFIRAGRDMESGFRVIGEYTIDEVVANWTGKMNLPLLLRQYPCYPRMHWIRCSNCLLFIVDGIDKRCVTRPE